MIKKFIVCSFALSVFFLFCAAEEVSHAQRGHVGTVSKDSDPLPGNPLPKGRAVYLSVDGMG